MRRSFEINGFKVEVELKDGKGKVRFDNKEFDVELKDRKGDKFLVSVSGENVLVRFVDDYTALINGRFLSFYVIERPLIKRFDGRASKMETMVPKEFLVAPIAGRVTDVLVKSGHKVSKGDTLVVLESMKMLIEVKSDRNGKVEEVLVKRGDVVTKGQPLIKFSKDEK